MEHVTDKRLINNIDLGRALIVLGMIAGLIITIFQDTGETLSLDLSGRFKSTEMNVIRVRPEYQDLIKDIEISPVTYRISARMGKFQRPLLIGIMFFVIIYSFSIVQILRNLVKSVDVNLFFSSKNVKRIRALGFLFIGASVIRYFYSLVTSGLAEKYFESDVIESTRFTISSFPYFLTSDFFVGFIILIIAQAFNHGLKLQQETELTI